ncbi:unnamed protein product [Cylindrotheca closterium]|uniref:Major facilitator superfamily (MFS) profile domain-containing protein n=1 Tax=Cylindrotheca closterium TaxID=2856 RepID=A0AAD2FRW7_9STRA|nr:unnamed protein product [Cylindrotheca closterium]
MMNGKHHHVVDHNGNHDSQKESGGSSSASGSPSLLSQSLQQQMNMNLGADNNKSPIPMVPVPQSPPRPERSYDFGNINIDPIAMQSLGSMSIEQFEQQRQQQQQQQQQQQHQQGLYSLDDYGSPKESTSKLNESPLRNWLPNNSDTTIMTSNIASAANKSLLGQLHHEEQQQQQQHQKSHHNALSMATSPPISTTQFPHLNGDAPASTCVTILKNADLSPTVERYSEEDGSSSLNGGSRRNIMGQKVDSKYAPIPAPPTTAALETTPTPVYYTFNSLFQASGNNSNNNNDMLLVTPTPDGDSTSSNNNNNNNNNNNPRQLWSSSIHAQSLLLGIAFMAIWTPNNAMAPNLTAMASDFHMTSDYDRDLYLGSYISLALGVFCLPISALLGFMADFYSRKYLFLACVVGGSLSTLWTAHAQTFVSLFWSRLSCGGCMSASVPVAFSLLGDLFAVEERNAASSGLTSMMGLGIIIGQVYAGTVGPQIGWPHIFMMSALLQAITALFVLLWVQEPTRGGKEKALQDMLSSGKKYDRQLTLRGFLDAMHKNRSNSILLWQGFFTSLPWGIIFVFLNDFLSQEKGFSVPDATLLVMLFGLGCAIGGIAGGYLGQVCLQYDRKYLPWMMAATTACGILPFIGLLETDFDNDYEEGKTSSVGYLAMTYALLCGSVASLPSVNVRPCIINVNPPETRGAALTASNLFITLGRGIGPSCITLLGIAGISRRNAFNITLTVFWVMTAGQLFLLGYTLPKDQDDMEAELERYAAMHTVGGGTGAGLSEDSSDDDDDGNSSTSTDEDRDSPVEIEAGKPKEEQENNKDVTTDTDALVPKVEVPPKQRRMRSPLRRIFGDNGKSPRRRHQQTSRDDPSLNSMSSIEEYMTSINSFDGLAARQSLQFVTQGIRELKEELSLIGTAWGGPVCGPSHLATSEENDDDFVIRSSIETGAIDLRVPNFEPDGDHRQGGISLAELDRRKQAWNQRRKEQKREGAEMVANEKTPLV